MHISHKRANERRNEIGQVNYGEEFLIWKWSSEIESAPIAIIIMDHLIPKTCLQGLDRPLRAMTYNTIFWQFRKRVGRIQQNYNCKKHVLKVT